MVFWSLDKVKIMAGLAQEFRDEAYNEGVTTTEIRFLTRILEKRIGTFLLSS